MRRFPLFPFLAACLLLGSPRASQSTLPDRVYPDNPAPLLYAPPERAAEGPPAAEHYVNVFLPPGSPPAAGWPVVVTTGFGGGVATPPQPLLGRIGPTAPLHALLREGIAVVSYGIPGVGGGRGLWYPPGHPSGRYESFHPDDDNPEKSAVWAVQWARSQTTYPFDLERMGMRGSSGGAVLAVRTTMGPDRALATGSAQVRTETRVRAVLAIQPPTSVFALAQGPELTLGLPAHLEQAASPGTPASTLDQVDHELQKDYSLCRTAFESAPARANNEGQLVCLVYADPVLHVGAEPATMALDATGFPVLHDAINAPYQHDSWFGYVFFRGLLDLSPAARDFHLANSTFAMREDHALPPPLDDHTETFAGPFDGPDATAVGHEWLVARLLGRTPPPPPEAGPLTDGSFELQTPGGGASAPWEAFGTGAVSVLSNAKVAETGLASEGLQWLAVGTAGTSGTTPPSTPGGETQPALGGSGVRQTFLFDPLRPHLQFEAAFVPGEPASSARNDWMSVDVSDGARTVNLHYADSFAPLPMTSLRTGSPMSAVVTRTADLSLLFPLATLGTTLTLTVQAGNAGGNVTPSIAYVDAFRLSSEVRVRPFGCGVNPSGSLTVAGGTATLGDTLVFAVDNPLGTHATGSLPLLAFSSVPAPGFPCGPLLDGFGMATDGVGELLFHPGWLSAPFLFGPAWQGPGSPALIAVAIPADPGFSGLTTYVQAVMYDMSSPLGTRIKFGEALEVTLGE